MRILIFGATGMVRQAAQRECLLDPGVDAVVTIRAAGDAANPCESASAGRHPPDAWDHLARHGAPNRILENASITAWCRSLPAVKAVEQTGLAPLLCRPRLTTGTTTR